MILKTFFSSGLLTINTLPRTSPCARHRCPQEGIRCLNGTFGEPTALKGSDVVLLSDSRDRTSVLQVPVISKLRVRRATELHYISLDVHLRSSLLLLTQARWYYTRVQQEICARLLCFDHRCLTAAHTPRRNSHHYDDTCGKHMKTLTSPAQRGPVQLRSFELSS